MERVGEKEGGWGRRSGIPTVIRPFFLILALGLLGCAKISDFNTPFVQEIFTGTVTITPVLKGTKAPWRGPGLVNIDGNGTGESVTISGLPRADYFEMWPKTGFTDQVPEISGLTAHVTGKYSLKIDGFAGKNDLVDEVGLTVRGSLLREGPKLATKPGEPIVIEARARDIKAALPSLLKERIVRIKDEARIDDIDDEEIIPLYEVHYVGQILSIF